MSENNERENLEALKLRAEINKLEAEKEKIDVEKERAISDKRQQDKPYFKQQAFYNTLLAVSIPLLTIIVGYFLAGGKQYFDTQQNLLEIKRYNLQKKFVEDSLREVVLINSFKDTARISYGNMLSAQEENRNLLGESSRLRGSISGLLTEKSSLKRSLEFAKIEKDLIDFKESVSRPDDLVIYNLINHISSRTDFGRQVFDSLLEYRQITYLANIANYILYEATSNYQYKEDILNNIIPDAENNDSLSDQSMAILTKDIWTIEDKKYATAKIFLSYASLSSNHAKLDVLSLIKDFNCDPSFNLDEINYDLLWTYLRFNRDLLESKDTSLYKIRVLDNIASFSPQLYFASLVRFNYQHSRDTALIEYSMITIGDFLCERSYKQLETFHSKNFSLLQKMFSNDSIAQNENLNSWLEGNFPKFRHNKQAYKDCLERISF